MNLLDTDSIVTRQKYVAKKMRHCKLSTVASKPKKKRFYVRKNVILYVMFAFLIICGTVVGATDKFIVNADKIVNAENSTVLGEFTAFSPSPLVPKSQKNAESGFIKGDNRVWALKKFLESKGSPASPYSDVFVSAADKYGMDYRLVASIAGVESNFCKFTTIRIDSTLSTYNCWGWGKNGKRFAEYNSFIESINSVTAGIAKGYGTNPTPSSMQYDYCHSCRGASDWQNGVTDYMSEIAKIEKSLTH